MMLLVHIGFPHPLVCGKVIRRLFFFKQRLREKQQFCCCYDKSLFYFSLIFPVAFLISSRHSCANMLKTVKASDHMAGVFGGSGEQTVMLVCTKVRKQTLISFHPGEAQLIRG